MPDRPVLMLSPEEINQLADDIYNSSENEWTDELGDKLEHLLDLQAIQPQAAFRLLDLINADCFPQDDWSLNIALEIYEAHSNNPEVVAAIGECFEVICDIDDLNSAAPEDEELYTIIDKLADFEKEARGKPEENDLLEGLSAAARMLGHQRGETAEAAYLRLLELNPEQASSWYNWGLFLKTRGRFAEGVKANQRALELADEEDEAYIWNLGICATGAGEGQIALDVWKSIQQKIEMGRFDLPEGGYPVTKVKLAQHPLAERTKENDAPGLEETIWIERLSPCHGIIRSVLYHGDLGVDFGDVILIDGAPITYHKYGDEEVPVFPHLATLKRGNYHFYEFAGTQEEKGQLTGLNDTFEDDVFIYPHSENVKFFCVSCWDKPDMDHEHKDTTEKNIVTGRIAVPPSMSAGELLNQLDKALGNMENVRLYAPSLCKAAGDEKRVEVETHRFNMLMNN